LIRNDGTARRGVLRWEVEMRRAEVPIELPPNARKEVYLSVPTAATLAWHEEGRAPRELSVGLPPQGTAFTETPTPLLVVGDLVGGFEGWRVLTTASGKPSVWTPSYLRPEAMPEDWTVLLSIPTIVLVEGAERLRATQWEALLAWMLHGGHLVIAAPTPMRVLQATPLRALVPPVQRINVVQLREPIPLLGAQLEPPESPLLLAQPAPTAGWHTYTSGKVALAQWRSVGKGYLTLFWGDLEASAWRQWRHRRTFGSYLLGVPRELKPPSAPRTALGRAYSERLRPKVMVATALLFAYSTWLYALRHILRKRDQLRRAPLYIAALATLVGVALAAVAQADRRAEVDYRSSVIAEKGLSYRMEIEERAYLLASGTHSITLPPEVKLLDAALVGTPAAKLTVRYATPVEVVVDSRTRVLMRTLTARLVAQEVRP
ncbi:MAG: hypothetical protein RMK45_05380, partial [Armatimonadota bacterium]|nr:hypothetical protein [Armatimonadota bacterium]